jgi:U3 small nucleolar ribonucleoprotein component
LGDYNSQSIQRGNWGVIEELCNVQDENKSKKGLGEIYEEEYMQSAGLAVAATPVTDSIKAEVSIYLYPITVLTLKSLCIFLTDVALA